MDEFARGNPHHRFISLTQSTCIINDKRIKQGVSKFEEILSNLSFPVVVHTVPKRCSSGEWHDHFDIRHSHKTETPQMGSNYLSSATDLYSLLICWLLWWFPNWAFQFGYSPLFPKLTQSLQYKRPVWNILDPLLSGARSTRGFNNSSHYLPLIVLVEEKSAPHISIIWSLNLKNNSQYQNHIAEEQNHRNAQPACLAAPRDWVVSARLASNFDLRPTKFADLTSMHITI